MSRYIDADTLKKQDFQDFSPTDVWNAIDDCPAADVAPVIHARWVKVTIEENDRKRTLFSCPICYHHHWARAFRYCPHCGAKMDLEAEDHA